MNEKFGRDGDHEEEANRNDRTEKISQIKNTPESLKNILHKSEERISEFKD